MLVLSRKKNERIHVYDENNFNEPLFTITVVEFTQTGKVRLGFECPRNLVVLREELVADTETFNAIKLKYQSPSS